MSKYRWNRTKGGGLAIYGPGGAEVAFLQGDEADELEEELDRAENLPYPRGPFASANSLVDHILGEYDN